MLSYFFIIFSFIIWSSYGILIKIFNLDPFSLTFYLSLFGLPFIFFTVRIKRIKINFEFKTIILIFFASVLLFGNTITFFWALKLTTVANTIIAHYFAPIIAAFFIPIFLKEKLQKITVISLTLAMIGIFLLFFPYVKFEKFNQDILGIIFALVSAFCYAFLIIIAKYLIFNINSLIIMIYENFFSMLLILLLVPFFNFTLKVNSKILILYFFMAITHNFIAPYLYLTGLENIKAQFAAVLGYIEPISAIILEIIFLKNIPTIYTIIGGILIVLSGIIIIIFGEDDSRKCKIS